MKSIDGNLVDVAWTNKPNRKFNQIISLSIQFAGQTIAKKLEIIRNELESNKCDSLIVTALDEVACNFFHIFFFFLIKNYSMLIIIKLLFQRAFKFTWFRY